LDFSGANALGPAIHGIFLCGDTGIRMKRFAVTVPVLLVVLVFASAAATQPAPKVARVGMLCNPLCNVGFNDAFLDELRRLGWVEGTNVVIERKDPDYRLDLLPASPPTSCDRNPISSSPSLLRLRALQRTRPRTYQL
jgi:hypothetical protein